MSNTILIVGIIIVLFIILITYLNSTPILKLYHAETGVYIRKISKSTGKECKVIADEDIADLPLLMQNHIKKTGFYNKPLISHANTYLKGKIRMATNNPWLKLDYILFDYFKDPLRVALIKGWMFGICSMAGRDGYIDGQGSMFGRLMKLVTIFDEKGKAYDISGLVTFLNDLILISPGSIVLLKDIITWKEIDEKSLQLSINHYGNEISATLVFNEKGLLVNFISEDRYRGDGNIEGLNNCTKTKWSTPIDEYKKVDNYLVPYKTRAVWHLDTGDFCYAEFYIDHFEFNP